MSLLKSAIGGIIILLASLFVLALVAQPGCACSPKWKAYQAAVKSDLRNLVTSQEAVFADDSTFAADLPRDFRASPLVHVRMIESTREGWRAVATHEQLQGECRVYVGRVTFHPLRADGSPVEEGYPVCWGVWPLAPSLNLRVYVALGLAARPDMPWDSAPGGASAGTSRTR